MAQQNLDIIINAQDKSASAFDSASRQAKGFSDRLEDLKPKFQAMATAGTVAFAAIGGVAYHAIQQAAESEKVYAQFDAVLKSTGATAAHTYSQFVQGAGDVVIAHQASGAEIKKHSEALEKNKEKIKETKEHLENYKDQLALTTAKVADMSVKMADGTKHSQTQIVSFQQSKEKITELKQKIEETTVALNKYSGQTEKITGTTTAVKGHYEQVTKAAEFTREALIGVANALKLQSTFDDDAILGAESLLLTFTGIGGKIFPDATKAILDLSVAMGQDLKSSTVQIGKALNSPIDGITALSRVGVSFTEQQKKQIETLQKSGHIMEAQRIILNELNKEFGGSAAAAAQTFEGRMTQLKIAMDDVSKSVGKALLPTLQAIVEKVTPIVGKMIEWADANPALISKLIPMGLAIAGLVAVIGGLGLVLPAIITAFTLLTGPVGAIVAIIALLVINFEAIKTAAIALWAQLADLGVIAIFKDMWDNIVSVWRDSLLPALQQLWVALEPLKPFFELFAKILGGIFLAALGGVIAFVMNAVYVFGLLLTVVTNIATIMAQAFKVALDTVSKAIESVYNWVVKVIDAFDRMWEAMKRVGGGAMSSIGSALGMKVNDAIITPTGRVITPAQDDYIMATKNPAMLGGMGGGSSMVVNVNGGNYLSESAANEFGAMLIDQLRVQFKI